MDIKTTEKLETNSEIKAITTTKITITNNKNRIKHEQLHCLGQFVSLPHTALPQGRGRREALSVNLLFFSRETKNTTNTNTHKYKNKCSAAS